MKCIIKNRSNDHVSKQKSKFQAPVCIEHDRVFENRIKLVENWSWNLFISF